MRSAAAILDVAPVLGTLASEVPETAAEALMTVEFESLGSVPGSEKLR